MQVQHGPVRLRGSAGWTDQQVDVFLNDLSHSWRALLVGQDGMLRDLERLTIRAQKPLQSFSFDETWRLSGLAALRVSPQHHVGRRPVRFDALSNASDLGNTVPEVGLELHSSPCKHWEPA
ncbi:hypothetical protein NCCP2145_03050 [Pseudarthrobacter sp. NCCP-2145]|nr:hypothetical protein NCCP2145_03050 [Pseudarthrobacter sp. NCCP-2145]